MPNLLEKLLILNQKIIGLDNFETGFKYNIDQAIDDQLNLYQTGLFYDVIIQPTDSIYYIYLFYQLGFVFNSLCNI